jgi:hypothetical protein
MRTACCLALLGCLVLGACSRDDEVPAGARTATGEALPAPAAISGSVTGMPDPGQAQPTPAPVAEVAEGEVIDPPADAFPPDALPTPPASDQGAESAVAALRQYYGAINARDYPAAHAFWADGGRASGQSLAGFAAAFADTEGSSVQFGAPGPVVDEGGSRTVTVPATVEARQLGGAIRRYAGSYTLRMGAVDAAGQQEWRIVSASLAEVMP